MTDRKPQDLNRQRVDELYSSGAEDTRLTHSRAAQVEFLTTMRVLNDYVRAGMRVLDLGAATGAYTLPLLELGCTVDAVELSETNAAILEQRLSGRPGGRVFRGSAASLDAFPDGGYDIVLNFGPMYHIFDTAERDRCIRESRRVCRADGRLFFAFISNDMVPLTECQYRDFFHPDTPCTYDHETFQVDNDPFVFYTLDQMRSMLAAGGLAIEREIASDGVSELMAAEINAMIDESYAEYLRYHYYCSEKPEMLGRSNHLLFVCRP